MPNPSSRKEPGLITLAHAIVDQAKPVSTVTSKVNKEPNTHPLNQNNTNKTPTTTHAQQQQLTILSLSLNSLTLTPPTLTFNSSQLDHRSSDRRTVAGYAKLTSPPTGVEGLSGGARVHSIRGGLQEVSVTKESIRGVSNRLAEPKLLKIFEFVTIESIRSSSEPILFWAETRALNLNRFVCESSRLGR
ncbi:hypothetical protein PIB30_072848 [Stylosanthes scabra]|uniref:Uncharacterized protein n=1 Tax=Stylosanthes scabra TaxID=79078 RepID=A0ABU6VML6_9FABA|nr:hypothetical protein [Stylosanthes scabra]